MELGSIEGEAPVLGEGTTVKRYFKRLRLFGIAA